MSIVYLVYIFYLSYIFIDKKRKSVIDYKMIHNVSTPAHILILQERKHTIAYVVCRMLGTHGGVAIQGDAHQFHGTKLPIVMDDVNCQGHERSIHDCPRKESGHNCDHSEDVAIKCGF